MRIIALSMVRNEADFIETFVRANAPVIDAFYIADDNSTDATRDILRALQGEGIPIRMFAISNPDRRLEYLQSQNMTDLLQYAQVDGFDYAFLLDADELILTSRGYVERNLAALGGHQYGALLWKTFVPLRADFPDHKNPLRNAFLPLKRETLPYTKAVIPERLVNRATVSPGNHFLVASTRDDPIEQARLLFPLCHFPVRSVEQIVAKSLVMCHKLLIKRNRVDGEGAQHFMIRDRLRRNDYALTLRDLQEIAVNYFDLGAKPFSHDLLGSFDGIEVPNIELRHSNANTSALGALDGLLAELGAEYRKLREVAAGVAPDPSNPPVAVRRV